MSDVPLEHLDYQYIRECKNGSEVERILKALRSGKEGHYPNLIEFTEKRLKELKPKSKLLSKAQRAMKSSELSHEEKNLLKDDLNEWQAEMTKKADQVTSHDDDDLPPIRSGQVSMKKPTDTTSKSNGTKATRIKSNDYKSWDKYDVDKEIATAEATEVAQPQSTHIPQPLTEKELMRLSKSEKETRAVKEKEKGNEAFHARDFHEAVGYYSRSLQLMPTALAYNNRAVVEIKLEKFKEAVEDCTAVLKLEPLNTKALMRRAIARHKLKQLEGAKEDLELLLKHQSHHKKAKELHETIQNELAKTTTKRRLKIEEVSESPEEVQPHVDKPSASHDAKSPGSYGTQPPGSHDATPHEVPLPAHVIKLKDQGNKLFQTGQYGEALDCYSNAISSIQKKGLNYNSSDVAVLFSNRAACYLKIGDCRSCVADCNVAISMAPANSYKPLLRRALAYETMEKYQLAYLDYQLVVNLNGSIEQARTGCTRLSKTLRDEHGADWRSKLPLPTDHEAVMKVQRTGIPSIPVVAQQGSEKTAVKSTEVRASNEMNKEQQLKKYEELKEKGNTLVKKGKYLDAVPCYTECVKLCPDNAAAYTNRALCHLKLSAPTAACDDCTKALKLAPDNVKALFRRALAMKECGQLSVAIDDLTAVLRIEPGNKAAQKELIAVRELNIAKEKESKKEGKKKKIPIIIDDDDDDDGHKKSQKSSSSSKTSFPDTPTHVDIDVTLTKATPYEFIQKWNSVPRSAGSQLHAQLLKQISPQQLPTLLSNKLDGNILPDILLALRDHFLTTDLAHTAGEMVEQLTRVERFSIVVKFLSASQKDVARDIFGYLEEKTHGTELSKFRKLYGV